MKTTEIKKEDLHGEEPICYGYKVVKWDNGTQQSFKYGETGENLVGKVFTVDGDIEECKWGLHFSKDPAYVFNFYEPLGYNKYFKVAAYGNVVDSADGYKSVAQTIEFIEEYDLMHYIELIKMYVRSSNAVRSSTAVRYSNAVRDSNAVSSSNAVSYSNAVRDSNAVSSSNAVCDSNAVCLSNAVSYSNAVRSSNAVCDSYGLLKCYGLYKSAFCSDKKGGAYIIFNKKLTPKRADEILSEIRSFNWYPVFDNWYDIKGNKKWWAFCFPQLKNVEPSVAWSKMPQEMKDYIFSLPEFDADVWSNITGIKADYDQLIVDDI